MTKRALFVVSTLLAVVHLGCGCGSISLKDGYYSCVPDFRGSCPSGMVCAWSREAGDFRCFSSPPSDGGTPDGNGGGDCGNGQVDQGEDCDGSDLGGMTCQGLGFPSGVLACSDRCRYDASHCDAPVTCGNGSIEPPEDCDGIEMGGATCVTVGYGPGTLGCLDNCTFDTSGCSDDQACGNGQLETGEECDDGNFVSHDGCSSGCTTETLTWVNPNPTNHPSARCNYALAYDPNRGCVLLFGGMWDQSGGGSLTRYDDTWEYCDGDWAERNPSNKPDARFGHAMTFDSGRDRMVLFGGLTVNGVQSDTWEWDGSNWTETSPAGSPLPRRSAAMAYDPGRGRVVLFGGLNIDSGNNYLNDTWEYSGSQWIEITNIPSPEKRAGHRLVYHAALGYVIVFGGGYSETTTNIYHNDTWRYEGTQWVQIATGAPAARSGHALDYDSLRDVAVLFGGWRYTGSSTEYNDTWEHDSTQWTAQSPSASPPRTYNFHMAYHQLLRRMVLFGGEFATFEYRDTTWTYGYFSSWPDEVCDNNTDDDSDGVTDCADPDCDGRRCGSGVCSGGQCL